MAGAVMSWERVTGLDGRPRFINLDTAEEIGPPGPVDNKLAHAVIHFESGRALGVQETAEQIIRAVGFETPESKR
jgi:hypothetical protein